MNVALIGYGYWGKIIHKYISNNKELNLIGIYSPHYESSISIDELINKGMQCAFVCTPIETHYEIVSFLLENRINVFCEKPLCKKYIETEKLIEIAKLNKVILFTDYIYTFSKSINLIKQKIKKIKYISFIEMELSQFGNFYKNDDVIDVLGVHLLSVLSYWFENEKDIKVKEIIPVINNSNGLIQSVVIYLQFGDIPVCMKCNLLGEKKVRKIIISYKNGMIKFDMLANETVKIFEFCEEKGIWRETINESYNYNEGNNLETSINFFISCVKGECNNFLNLMITKKVSEVNDKIKSICNF